MESREHFQSSHTTSSDTMTDDDKKLTAADLAYWQTQMRWLIPLVQATGYQVVIDNPKSHEQIIIDQNMKRLPELTLEWMQKYNKQELAEWISNEEKREQREEIERQKRLEAHRLEELRGRTRFGNSFTLDDKSPNDRRNKNHSTNKRNYVIPLLCVYVFILAMIGLWVYNSPAFETERREKEWQKLLEVSNSSNNYQEENDSLLNAKLRTLVNSTLAQHIKLKLDSCSITSSLRNGDTLKSISGAGFSKLYKEIFDVTGCYIVSQNILSCKSLKVTHRYVGSVFEINGNIISNHIDSLTFSQQIEKYNKLRDELWQERKDLIENAYANRTKVHFGISRDEYNRLGEDFQRHFYEGLVGYGAYELAKPTFDKKDILVGFEIEDRKEKTFSYYNVQNNADLIRNEQLGYDAHECFRYVYVCDLYNMEIISRYDKFDRKTEHSLKACWNEWVKVYR